MPVCCIPHTYQAIDAVGLEGSDGSFVLLDVAGGLLRGLDVVTWPDDIRTVDALAPAAARTSRD